MKILVEGYFGHRNFGDDLLLKVALDRLDPGGRHEIAVSCGREDAEYLREWFPEVTLSDPSSPRQYARYDRILLGGGGTLFEYRADLSIPYIARKTASHILRYGWARASASRFGAVGIGIGPFADSRARWTSLFPLRFMDFVHARDGRSFEHARRVVGARAGQAPDLSFGEYPRIEAVARSTVSSDRVVFILRRFTYGDEGDTYLDAAMAAASRLQRKGTPVEWVSFQEEYDRPVIERLEEEGHPVWSWDPRSMSLQAMYRKLAEAACIVTARMHGVHVGGMMGVPTVAIALHPKLCSAASIFEGATVVPGAPSAAELLRAVDAVSTGSRKASPELLAGHHARVEELFRGVREWAGLETASGTVPSPVSAR